MLCGLLTASGGELNIAGTDVRRAPASARSRLGYVAQKFSLYGPLTVTENLEFFASAYGLRGERRRSRIAWAMQQFELGTHALVTSAQLPGGFKQRLAMAAALLHEPEILFLDEPTSGADPLARRVFWRRITALAEQGVTVIVTTHFMQEAEYCDRVAIMDSGKVLAQGSPGDIRQRASTPETLEPSMDDAFIADIDPAGGRVAGRCRFEYLQELLGKIGARKKNLAAANKLKPAGAEALNSTRAATPASAETRRGAAFLSPKGGEQKPGAQAVAGDEGIKEKGARAAVDIAAKQGDAETRAAALTNRTAVAPPKKTDDEEIVDTLTHRYQRNLRFFTDWDNQWDLRQDSDGLPPHQRGFCHVQPPRCRAPGVTAAIPNLKFAI